MWLRGCSSLSVRFRSILKNFWSLDALGWGYYKQGRYAQAVEVLEQAEDLSPKYEHPIRQHLEAARKALAGGK